MKKKHDLPHISIGTFADGTPVEDFFKVDSRKLDEVIKKEFYANLSPEDVMTKDGRDFKPFMSACSLEVFKRIYPSLTNRDFVYAMYTYVDAILRHDLLMSKNFA